MLYSKETESIRVSVRPFYLEEESEPEMNHYCWAYHVRIENRRSESVRLVGRLWRITDANGVVRRIKGAGVIGEQPVLAPGEVFEYTSGAPLPTCSGFMLGSYYMIGENGQKLHIDIPEFSLDMPNVERVIN